MTEEPPQPSGPAERERADPRLLELLVCPISKASLIYDEAAQELISRQARLAYPIRRGVPHLLPSEARPLEDDDKRA
jgi:uncharacterized protein YbaR (Trm112 family)